MSTKKFLRELQRRAEQEGFELVRLTPRRTAHFTAVFSHSGAVLPAVTLSCSPTNMDHAIGSVLRELRRIKP